MMMMMPLYCQMLLLKPSRGVKACIQWTPRHLSRALLDNLAVSRGGAGVASLKFVREGNVSVEAFHPISPEMQSLCVSRLVQVEFPGTGMLFGAFIAHLARKRLLGVGACVERGGSVYLQHPRMQNSW